MAKSAWQMALAAAVLLLLAAQSGCSAATMSTAADFLSANADQFQCITALLDRSGLSEAMSMDLPNTYFFPGDAAFVTDLAQTAPALDVSSPSGVEFLTVEQVLGMIKDMSADNAANFVKAHVAPAPYASVSALAFPDGAPAAAAVDPNADSPPPTNSFTNSLEQQVDVYYEAGYHALHLDIKNNVTHYTAYVAGPVAIPAGQATIYVLLNVLADPDLITHPSQQPAEQASPANPFSKR